MTLTTYARRLLRWEADVPLMDDQRTALIAAARDAFQPLGPVEASFDEQGDSLTLRLRHARFPALVQRRMALWLCAQTLIETASIALAQAGTMLIGSELPSDADWSACVQPLREISDWWNEVSPIPGPQARRHRTQLQTIVKRRQYNTLGGYVSRELRVAPEPGLACYAFVPLVIEAIWSQHADLSLHALCAGLNLDEMTRRPREALLAWLNVLPSTLRRSPSAATAAPIDRVIAGIQADCSLPYSQQNLSRSLGLTPAYFCRLFLEKTGQHFSTFLTRTRMEKAQSLLSDGREHSLAEVSLACGYPNKSYFCQVFKKYTGLTPGEYEQRSK
ncbi:MAG: helix-turn-helix transcriptional regulator [Clostridiales bacterium]|nr:helix-turn-helix transcriptional regulator [Clostridiales bacterium]